MKEKILSAKELFTEILKLKNKIKEFNNQEENKLNDLPNVGSVYIGDKSYMSKDLGLNKDEKIIYIKISNSIKSRYVGKFETLIDENIRKIFGNIPSHFQISKNKEKHHNRKNVISFETDCEFYSINTNTSPIKYFKIKTQTEELNAVNLFDCLKLYENFYKLEKMSDIKDFKMYFFGNITGKKFNPFIEELEKENKVIVERSSTGAIKNILINNKIDTEIKHSKTELAINDIKSKGLIKNIHGIRYSEERSIYEFKLSNLNLFEVFNLTLSLKNGKLDFNLTSYNLYDTYRTLEELELWGKTKDKIIKEFKSKLPLIKQYLGYDFKEDDIQLIFEDDIFGFRLSDINLVKL